MFFCTRDSADGPCIFVQLLQYAGSSLFGADCVPSKDETEMFSVGARGVHGVRNAKFGAKIEARAAGYCVRELHENIRCDTVGFKEALATARRILERSAEALASIAKVLGMRGERLDEVLMGSEEVSPEDTPMQLHVEGSVGTGCDATLCLGWQNTKGYHLAGVGLDAPTVAGLGCSMFAGRHHTETSVMIKLGIGSFAFAYKLPIKDPLVLEGEPSESNRLKRVGKGLADAANDLGSHPASSHVKLAALELRMAVIANGDDATPIIHEPIEYRNSQLKVVKIEENPTDVMRAVPLMCPSLILPHTEARFMIRMDSLQKVKKAFDIVGTSGRKLMHGQIGNAPDSRQLMHGQIGKAPDIRRCLALSSVGCEDDPRSCILTSQNGGQHQALEQYGNNGQFYGYLDFPSSSQGELQWCGSTSGIRQAVLKIDKGSQSEFCMKAFTMDGRLVASAGKSDNIADQTVLGNCEVWKVKVKPGQDSVLITSCMLGMILFHPWSFDGGRILPPPSPPRSEGESVGAGWGVRT